MAPERWKGIHPNACQCDICKGERARATWNPPPQERSYSLPLQPVGRVAGFVIALVVVSGLALMVVGAIAYRWNEGRRANKGRLTRVDA